MIDSILSKLALLFPNHKAHSGFGFDYKTIKEAVTLTDKYYFLNYLGARPFSEFDDGSVGIETGIEIFISTNTDILSDLNTLIDGLSGYDFNNMKITFDGATPPEPALNTNTQKTMVTSWEVK